MQIPLSEHSAVESQATLISLSDDEASLLASLGRELASARSWWGGTAQENERSIIRVERVSGDQFSVTFRDAIGVVRLPQRVIRVAPKIPLDHFIYIANRSDMAPRTAAAKVNVDVGEGFLEVLAQWCTGAAEALLRSGLRKDYRLHSDELSEVRGRLLDCETVIEISRGRAVALCEFDELSDDAPLNRVVRAACERLARMKELSDASRTRARRIVYRMDGVGALELPDLRVRADRLSKEYSRVVPLALLVLAGCGISSTVGKQVGTAFLIRTPELIEDGMRNMLSELLPEAAVTKRRLILGESGLSMNPDLVFGAGAAVGDVKYRYLTADWNRADLNQSVAFATAFRCTRCIVVGFVRDPASSLPKLVPVGPVSATCMGWIASESTKPAESFCRLGERVRNWWSVADG